MKDFSMELYFRYNIDGYWKEAKEKISCYHSSWKNIPDDKMKTWKHYITISRPCGHYESGIVHIYKTKKKDIFALVTYYDGSFYPLVTYSRLTANLIQAINEYKEYQADRRKNK